MTALSGGARERLAAFVRGIRSPEPRRLMTAHEELNAAADLALYVAGGDALLRATGEWLRAEAVTQQSMEPLVELLSMAVETSGGPKAYLRVGKRDDGELAMHASTNEHALAVAAEIQRRFGHRSDSLTTPTSEGTTR